MDKGQRDDTAKGCVTIGWFLQIKVSNNLNQSYSDTLIKVR